MGAQISTIKNKLGLAEDENPTLKCLKCGKGEWRFIGSEGNQYVHTCLNCHKTDKFYNVYGMASISK